MRSLALLAALTPASALLDFDESALNDKVEKAKAQWAKIREHTKEMLESVHEKMESNIKKLDEDRKSQNEMMQENMKSIDAILKKDAALHGSKPAVAASFLQQDDRSPQEIEAAKRTELLLKQLNEIVHGGKKEEKTASSFAEVASEDPAIKALKEAQARMLALQQDLHKQAMSLSGTHTA